MAGTSVCYPELSKVRKKKRIRERKEKLDPAQAFLRKALFLYSWKKEKEGGRWGPSPARKYGFSFFLFLKCFESQSCHSLVPPRVVFYDVPYFLQLW